jgi:hypothetical protein
MMDSLLRATVKNKTPGLEIALFGYIRASSFIKIRIYTLGGGTPTCIQFWPGSGSLHQRNGSKTTAVESAFFGFLTAPGV